MHEGFSSEDLSLEQIEEDAWREDSIRETRLIETVHALRRVPLRELQIEDLRMLISQQVGLDVLIPRAIVLLKQDPLTEGDLYPGDLLVSVLKVPPSYWRANLTRRKELEQIVEILHGGEHGLEQDIVQFLAGNR